MQSKVGIEKVKRHSLTVPSKFNYRTFEKRDSLYVEEDVYFFSFLIFSLYNINHICTRKATNSCTST